MSWIPIATAAQVFKCSRRTIRRRIVSGMFVSKLSNGLRFVWMEERVDTVSSHKHDIPKERLLVPLFELYEGLCTLRMRFEGPLEMEDWLTQCVPPSPQGTSTQNGKQWKFFFDHLDSCFRKVDALLEDFYLNQTILRNLYRTLVILKSHGQEAGIYLVSEKTGDQGTPSPETLKLFEHLLQQVRTLLLLSVQSSSSESVSSSFSFRKSFLDIGAQGMGKVKEKHVSPPPTNVGKPSISETMKSIPATKGTKHEKPN